MTKIITFEGRSFKVDELTRYVAKDSCGAIYAYNMKPRCISTTWFAHEEENYVEYLGESLDGGNWWEDSLIEC